MRSWATKQKGFTIVELLIVIVVIAVLAAIAIVAYNGIQKRGLNAARASAAQSAVKLVQSYIVQEGKYPFASTACLGKDFPDNKCYNTDSGTTLTNSTLDTNITAIGTAPSVVLPSVQTPSYKALGPVYNYSAGRTINGESNPVLILYWLDGSAQKCPTPNVAKQLSQDDWSTDNTTAYTYSYPDATSCYIGITTKP